MLYNLAADSFYIMKLCSRLHCRNRPKYDRSSHFDPHFEEARGGVDPWLMARWKARIYDFLFAIIELLFLSLAVEALQGKACQDSLLSGWVGQFEPRFQGKGSSLGNIFGSYKTMRILLSDSANCTVLRAVVLTQYRRVTDRRTDRRMDEQTDRRTELP